MRRSLLARAVPAAFTFAGAVIPTATVVGMLLHILISGPASQSALPAMSVTSNVVAAVAPARPPAATSPVMPAVTSPPAIGQPVVDAPRQGGAGDDGGRFHEQNGR